MRMMHVLAEEWRLGVLMLLSVYIAYKLYIYNRLRHLKGPFGVGFTNFLQGRQLCGIGSFSWYEDVAEKHGPISRIGPNILLVSDPQIWARVTSRAGYRKPNWWYRSARIVYGQDSVFTETNTEKHEHRRRQAAPGYYGKTNYQLEQSIDANISKLIDLVRSKYLSTTGQVIPMDAAEKIHFLTLDISSILGLGRSFGMLSANKDMYNYGENTEKGLLTAAAFMALGLGWIPRVPIIGPLIVPKAGEPRGFGLVLAAVFEIVDERLSLPKEKQVAGPDMLSNWISQGLSYENLRTESANQIIAGADTTASTLRSVLLHIMTNPCVYKKLQAEIDETVSSEKLSPVSGSEVIAFSVARKLPYLQAVIKEVMRVWPIAVSFTPRVTPAQGDTFIVDGKPVRIPGGVDIGIGIQAILHNKDIFGHDAKFFRPERWLEQSDEKRLELMTKTSDLVWGQGTWQCLGKQVVYIEMSKTIFELFRHFDWALLKPSEAPWRVTSPFGLCFINDMWVQVTSR
ncbi:pisatin demethylase [Podospora aff. communis PSN243]|uniref:Pisatin demethylase n=1 Tax=Podospora aff. communis PSN243 TaxID=3040156 RepID=A0AAV9GG20_9PEZI|nr:pisatin demethylase [Podospora aff. communis PSN243]